MAVGGGASQRIQTEMRNLGANTIVLNSGALKSGGVSKGQGSRPSVTLADAQAIENEVPAVVAASPQQNFAGMQLIYGNANWSTLVTGTTPEYLTIRNWTVSRGRAFDREDVVQGGKVVVLGRTVAENLFGNQSPVGQEIRINRIPMMVIGELAAKGQSLFGLDTDDTAVIPISTALNRVIGRNPASGDLGRDHQGARRRQHGFGVRRDSSGRARAPRSPARTGGRFSPGQSNGSDAGQGGLGAGARDSARCYRVRVAPGWRDRHHEHHARLGHRADPRNRAAARGWRPGEATSWANSWSRRRSCP
jgi:MacB-like periplasmic core domain